MPPSPLTNLSKDFWSSSRKKATLGLDKDGPVHPQTGNVVDSKSIREDGVVWSPDAARWELNLRGKYEKPSPSPSQAMESVVEELSDVQPAPERPAPVQVTQGRVPLPRPGRFAESSFKKNVVPPAGPQQTKVVQPTGQVVAANRAKEREQRNAVVQRDIARTSTPGQQQKQSAKEQMKLSVKQEFQRYRDKKEQAAV